ncbi:hypothetical protein SAMN05192558_10769 [Actinokineospora alba]|uniref:Uncharacterized protein n=2 Tax=Actinokineospora alba TaxID=504798 RepID=A0A1H0QNA4_9PSEU|nr:hypothetical protein C8E96_6082 [Actinokineospora alba]SDI30815.1 hypothetical protein SAMN05421871_10468 [Actinokineospora alba]SDP18804.1 hypothetical protein SAMN05192558_10769 [Actinokineospora alba]
MALDVTHRGKTTSHQDGHGFLIKDGHLTVMTSQFSTNSFPIATYAPGSWDTAVIVPESPGGYDR